ncbi:hypothetical protein BD311DRAFT_155744 [Dichomitus squalens]|uniref:Uncharacterized protein n=1 Tax=Dichomitus squalens TaxID=114155 RepID=A0A4Q9M8N2_9APHY|nr:hypothetical protein BD311DRAFT_155744 [Dichomitus squalens]
MKKYLFALAAFWTIGIALNPSLEWGEVSVCRRCRQGKGKSNSGYDGCCGCCGATRKVYVRPAYVHNIDSSWYLGAIRLVYHRIVVTPSSVRMTAGVS